MAISFSSFSFETIFHNFSFLRTFEFHDRKEIGVTFQQIVETISMVERGISVSK